VVDKILGVIFRYSSNVHYYFSIDKLIGVPESGESTTQNSISVHHIFSDQQFQLFVSSFVAASSISRPSNCCQSVFKIELLIPINFAETRSNQSFNEPVRVEEQKLIQNN